MSRANIVDHYIGKLSDPHFEIDQIRKELEGKDMPDEEIRVIVQLVDNELQKQLLAKSTGKRSNEFVVVGMITTIVSEGATL